MFLHVFVHLVAYLLVYFCIYLAWCPLSWTSWIYHFMYVINFGKFSTSIFKIFPVLFPLSFSLSLHFSLCVLVWLIYTGSPLSSSSLFLYSAILNLLIGTLKAFFVTLLYISSLSTSIFLSLLNYSSDLPCYSPFSLELLLYWWYKFSIGTSTSVHIWVWFCRLLCLLW